MTICFYTPAQNGLAERKNRYQLELARCMMISIKVSKYLCGQAIMTTAQLINQMPYAVLEWQTPLQILQGKNGAFLFRIYLVV
jgi:hypothetical protein